MKAEEFEKKIFDLATKFAKLRPTRVEMAGDIDNLFKSRVNAISDERKRVANELQGELIQANEDLANGKLIEVKWIKHTSFIKGKISALLNY